MARYWKTVTAHIDGAAASWQVETVDRNVYVDLEAGALQNFTAEDLKGFNKLLRSMNKAYINELLRRKRKKKELANEKHNTGR